LTFYKKCDILLESGVVKNLAIFIETDSQMFLAFV